MAYRTIVIGTDGSPTANLAQAAALRVARVFRSEVVFVTSYQAPRMNRLVADSVAEQAVEAARREKVGAVDAEVAEGEPAELILDVAHRRGAGLIVVGNKGIGQATRFRLGSVPDRVAHFAPCDVLIVDTSRFAEESTRRPGQYRTMLAATDGSPTASEAARKAFELALLLGSEVTLCYVGDPIVGAIMLEETANSRPEEVDVRSVVTQGEPSARINAVAAEDGIDLIVVGNKGMSGPRRFLMGAVPNQVAHTAPTDVLIVKTMDRSVDDIVAGHGAVVDVHGRKLAVYRDPNGTLVALTPKCTHMGCTVDWNDAERTWDCPCHGSRYGVEGQVLRGPAPRPLTRVEIDGRGKPHRPKPKRRSPDRFVIVGAALSGATAAGTLRREGFDGDVVLIGSEPQHPYQRPPLSKSFLRGETPFEEALVEDDDFYADNDIELRLGVTATTVDAAARVVVLQDGDRIPFTKLLISTGSRNRRFPIPGLDLPGVHDLRTVADAEAIRADAQRGGRAVVAGAGFIGSEVAASLRQRGLEVSVVDGMKAPLERVLGDRIGGVLAGIHRDHGVEMFFEERVAAFEGGDRVERVVTAGGRTLPCDFAVVGLGVEPVTELAATAAVELGNGVAVDEWCRTSVEGIFASGDVANHFHPVFGRRVRVEHWQHAIKHGRAAALSMMGRGRPYDEVHWFWSDQYTYNLQYAGFHTEWDDLVVRGDLDKRNFTAFYLKDGVMLATVAMGRGGDVLAAMPIIRARLKVDAARLADDDFDLRTLAPEAPALA
jgi:3-phenylpropionate/trans-cinnamate dioxygenase ferredoxin reductase component